MGSVVPFRRPRRELWRPSLARRQRAARARLPLLALSVLTLVSTAVGIAMAGWPG